MSVAKHEHEAMARRGAEVAQVVCQVVHKPGRMSILWSDGAAAFEPIHLEGDALAGFEQVARRGRQVLAEAGLGNPNADSELVNIGRDLHARFFAGGVGAEVANWLRGLENVEALEIGTDTPGRVTYALFDDPEQPGPWGRRFPLAVGRRVSPLRTYAQLATTNVVVAVDNELRERLSDASRAGLDAFLARTGAAVVSSRLQLKGLVEQTAPDVLWLLARLEGGAWIVAGERVTPQDLRGWIRSADEGNSLPVVVSTGVAGADAVTSWECFLSAATTSLPGFVSLETPANASAACDIGLSLLNAFLVDKLPIARALQQVRLGTGSLGLSFATFTPPRVRVFKEGDADVPPSRPLPAEPYHPLRPLDREDRGLLFGRDDDIEACAVALDQPNVAGLLIHGRSGVGKASLVRAGLLPFLEEENRGFYVLRDRTEPADAELEQPTLALRTGPDLVGSLVMGLAAFAARPITYTTPTGRVVTVDLPGIVFGAAAASETAIREGASDGERKANASRSPAAVWDQVADNPGAIADLFDRASRDLPFDLLIPLEQLEDMVTLTSSKPGVAGAVLQELAKSPGRFHVVATLRTERLGEVQPLLGNDYVRAAWKDYFLDELSEAAVQETLLAPTNREPLAGGETPAYGFDFDPGIATSILTHVKEQSGASGYGAIQLVHALAGQLYDECRTSKLSSVRQAEFKKVTKKGAIDGLVESRLKALTLGNVAEKARGLIASLHRDDRGIVTRDLVPLDSVEKKWKAPIPAQQVVNLAVERGPLLEAHNLFVDGKERMHVTVPQDLLANYGAEQERLKSQQKFARSKVLDSLFVFVPLTILGMAVVFFLLQRYRAWSAKADGLDGEKAKMIFEEGFDKGREDGARATRFAVYSGNMALADAAIRQGNTLRARQWLLAQQPQAGDVRGFEWFYLWRKISGEEANLVDHKAQVRVLAMSPDGKALVSGDEAGKVLLWNLEDVNEPLVAELKGLKGPVVALAISPDGSAIAGTDGGTKVVTWDAVKRDKTVAELAPKTTLTTEGKNATCLTFVGDAKSLAVGDEDKSVTLFDVAEKKAKWKATDHEAAVRAITTYGDGAKLASASDKELIAWTSDGKKGKSEAYTGGTVAGLTADGDSGVVVLGSKNSVGSVVGWNPGNKLIPVDVDLPGANGIAIVPGAKVIAAAGQDQAIRLLGDAVSEKSRKLLGHVAAVRSVAGGGDKLASVGYDNTIKIWNVKKILAERDTISAGGRVTALAFDPSERILASAGSDKSGQNGLIEFWSNNGDRIGQIDMPNAPITCLAFSPKEKLLLAAGVGNDVQTWEVSLEKDAVTATPVATLKKHSAAVTCLAFDSDGKALATGGLDKTINVWSMPEGKHLKTMERPAPLTALSFDGFVISGDARGVAVIAEPSGRAGFPPYQAHGAAITGIMLIKQSALRGVASVSADQSFRTWAVDPKAEQFVVSRTYRGHHQPETCLAQGKGFFATGALDGTVKLWDYSLPDERYTFNLGSPVRAVAIANTRGILAAVNDDRVISLMRAVPQPKYGPVNVPQKKQEQQENPHDDE